VYDDDHGAPLGIVPVEGRGSTPFALLHGEPLVSVASWTLDNAGVELLDFTTSWEEIRSEAVHRRSPLVIHDPLCPGTPASFVAEAVTAARDGVVVVGSRPVTDTVKTAEGDTLGETVDRSELLAVTSPVVIPASVVAVLSRFPPTEDLADLVVALRADHDVRFLEAPAASRRVSDESDLQLLEALVRESA
jgi:2-C-methyl-D-erythritol 4-phosphate cytidylyltransferase